MSVPLRRHWKVGELPLTLTLKVARWPSGTVASCGCPLAVKLGGVTVDELGQPVSPPAASKSTETSVVARAVLVRIIIAPSGAAWQRWPTLETERPRVGRTSVNEVAAADLVEAG